MYARFNGLTLASDRRAPVTIQPSEAPAAFRQNMNRNKTKKWVNAKTYNYDGDDWGDYDEDDEYGAKLSAQSGPKSALQRSSSFERGDEKRTFSATTSAGPISGTNAVKQIVSHAQQTNRAASGQSAATTEGSDASSNIPEHRRDFTPSAMPQPLSTGRASSASPAPGDHPIRSPSAAGAYDPRESSTAQPFVRPADIYKRMEEAKSKESLARTGSDQIHNDTTLGTKTSLADIPERKSEHGMPGVYEAQASTDKYRLPDLAQDSGFGDDMWSPAHVKSRSEQKMEDDVKSPTSITSSNLDTTSTVGEVPSRAPSQGFKSMVNRAFEPSELLGVSKQDSLRSQRTDGSRGTSDISPILASHRESRDHTTENILSFYSDDEPLTPDNHDTPKASRVIEHSFDSSEPAISSAKAVPTHLDNSAPATLAKPPSPEKPLPIPKEKSLPIRPKIPGQFDSYAFAPSEEPTPLSDLPGARYFARSSEDIPDDKDVAKPSGPEVPDLSPSVVTIPPAYKAHMGQLSAAGAAMGKALEQAFRVDSPTTAPSAAAREISDSPASSTQPAKDEEDSPLTPIAPLAPSKATSQITDEPTSRTSDGAVLQSTAIAPTVATAQSSVVASADVVTPEVTQASSASVAALPSTRTSMLDVEPSKRSMLDIAEPQKESIHDADGPKNETIVSLPSAKPAEEERTTAPKINRQFSWETDTPSASDTVLSPTETGPTNELQTEGRNEGQFERHTDGPHERHLEPASHVVIPLGPDTSPDNERQQDSNVSAPLLDSGLDEPTSLSPIDHVTHDISRSEFNESHPMKPVTEKNERLPSFKEIMNIKSTPDRLAAYDNTREEWLHMDSGLNTWLAATLEQIPEHLHLKEESARPFGGPSTLAGGSKRSHMRTTSIGGIGKLFTHGAGTSSFNPENTSPIQEKRVSAGGTKGGAGKAVGDTLKGLGGKSKGLLGKIKASRRKDDDGY